MRCCSNGGQEDSTVAANWNPALTFQSKAYRKGPLKNLSCHES